MNTKWGINVPWDVGHGAECPHCVPGMKTRKTVVRKCNLSLLNQNLWNNN